MQRVLLNIFFFSFLTSTSAAYEILDYNQQEQISYSSGLNLVFVSRNYNDWDNFHNDISFIVEHLLKTEPFAQVKENINVYLIRFNAKDRGKDIYKNKSEFPYVSIKNDFIFSLQESIRFPFKLIIMDANSKTYAAEYSDIHSFSLLVLGKKLHNNPDMSARAFLHELGHSLGLRDEYEKGTKTVPGYPNCAADQEMAQIWWGDLIDVRSDVGFFKGCCGDHKNIRPTKSSLMNNIFFSKSFGPVNERFLLKAILSVRLYAEHGSFCYD